MFKNLIGRGHPEFSGKQQQDAQVILKQVTFKQFYGERNIQSLLIHNTYTHYVNLKGILSSSSNCYGA